MSSRQSLLALRKSLRLGRRNEGHQLIPFRFSSSTSTTTSTATSSSSPSTSSSSTPSNLPTCDEIIRQRMHCRLLANELESLGSTQTYENSFRPGYVLTKPKQPHEVTLSHLIAAEAHLGHASSLSSRSGFAFTYGIRNGICIIDVRQTLTHLRRAAQVVKDTVERDGTVLFLSTLPGTERAVRENAKRLGLHGYAATSWIPGTLTNPKHIYSHSSLAKHIHISPERQQHSAPNANSYKPSILIALTPRLSKIAIKEATSSEVVTIGLIDTDVDPRAVTYPIPCNDDSVRAIEFMAGVLGSAGEAGLQAKAKREQREKSQKRNENRRHRN